MKRIFALIISAILVLSFSGFAVAAASKKDAETMVKKGVTFLKKNGRDAALAEFSKTSGQFVKGELYLYVIDTKANILAHGANAKLIGKNMIDIKDAGGKLFMKETLEVAKKGSGWIEYQWTNPISKKIQPKVAYLQKEGDLIVVCGVYK